MSLARVPRLNAAVDRTRKTQCTWAGDRCWSHLEGGRYCHQEFRPIRCKKYLAKVGAGDTAFAQPDLMPVSPAQVPIVAAGRNIEFRRPFWRSELDQLAEFANEGLRLGIVGVAENQQASPVDQVDVTALASAQ